MAIHLSDQYTWDNVYNYDITFRHLMAFNPNRSWAVCYNQMWNLSMRDPLPKNNGKGHFNPHHYPSGGKTNNPNTNHNNGNQGHSRRKSDYCWNFNKSVHCKFGKKCKFIERCSYCDSPNHGVNICNKLEQKKNGSTSNSSSENNHNKS